MDPIRIEGLKAPPPRGHGAVSQLIWVAIKDLVVDHSYQRDLTGWSKKHVEKIAAEFDWALFAPLIVAPVAGGCYAVIDGQHRATAALLAGETQAPAMVVIADRATQAKSFAAVNGVVFKMTAMAVFKAAVAAGEPKAVLALQLAADCGVRVLSYPAVAKQQKPGDTLAAASLIKAIDACGPIAVRCALTAIMASQGDKRGLVDSANIRALAMLFAERPMPLDIVKKAFGWLDLRVIRSVAARDGFSGLYTDIKDETMKRLQGLAARPAAARAPAP